MQRVQGVQRTGCRQDDAGGARWESGDKPKLPEPLTSENGSLTPTVRVISDFRAVDVEQEFLE